MVFIEDKCLLDEKEKEYIDELITNNCFPYFYQNTAVNDDHYPFLCHTLKFTDKDKHHSSQTEKFLEILDKFCKKHEIYYDTVYRVAINLTYNNGYKQSGIGREFGNEGLNEYTELKTLYVDDAKTRDKKPWYDMVVAREKSEG